MDGKDNTKQFTGKIKDVETGLNYFEARYLDSKVGRFTQIDPLTRLLGLNVKGNTGKELWEILSNPIALNAYAYANDNPITNKDPNGQQTTGLLSILPERAQIAIGNWANKVHDNNAVARYIMDHPYQTGAALGLAGGTVTVGVVVGTGGVVVCGMLCGVAGADLPIIGTLATQADRLSLYAQKFGNAIAEKMVKVEDALAEKGLSANEHALERIVIRESRGVTVEKVVDTFYTGTRYFDKVYKNVNYYKDGIRLMVDESKQILSVVEQKTIDLSRFIKIDN